MEGFFHARKAYEAFTAAMGVDARWDHLQPRAKEAWRAAASAVTASAAASIEVRATTMTLPDLLELDPDSSPTPIEVPHPQHGAKR